MDGDKGGVGDASIGSGVAAPGSPWRRDDGMATVEYALVTVAAAGFAGLLLVILKSDEVRGMLVSILQGALGG
ncbi:DUF4244 domain-containing protein [Demequina sp. SYSU T00039]|uniref:DUF4244 domain-containing protein n=1 Tax=Demequina lignilytica TaxID=3051663 RepID=A0AAW7M1Q2_9MICO|nr:MULTISPECIES: DUF4244 domain-containing protein [unclassified Demequina]MDN4478600.1 DUF4244 domain-containing protein [Demequina sp. SYSU T00039-1]MDN4488578.1 DUF4244 domain-containing protein [Demequina sp. SYSU T00039]MDN4491604.1 DUF4244 domain-containing protein [Demequina sp. SYSU T00068]